MSQMVTLLMNAPAGHAVGDAQMHSEIDAPI
jgi:hypothetical protein